MSYGLIAALHALQSEASPPVQPVPSQLLWQAVQYPAPLAYVLSGQPATHAVPFWTFWHALH
jgi:hypothetical protein